jgi:anti-sigma-K factor RskA
MDHARPELADRLAAAYVNGTLRGPARRRFETLLVAHPALRQAVADWQDRLLPLTAAIPPVEPPASVWQRIERQLGLDAKPVAETGLRRRLGWWRTWAAGASLAVVVLAGVIAWPSAPTVPVVIVLSPTDAASAELSRFARTSFVAGMSPDHRAVTIRPVSDVAPGPDRSFELWAVPGQGAPRSLGLLSNAAATTVRPAEALRGAAALAVSLEPSGGSPTGAPTGPVLFVGKL